MRSVTSSTSAARSSSASATRSARSVLTMVGASAIKLLLQALERRFVSLDAPAAHRGYAQLAHDRQLSPLLAAGDVGEVHLDGRQSGDLQRVADGPRVVRPGAGVHDDGVREAVEAVEVLDELALGVGLEEAHLEPEVARVALDLLLQAVVGQLAVDGRRTAAELVEVDPVHDLDAVAGAHRSDNSRTAARTSAAPTAWPVVTRPGACTST